VNALAKDKVGKYLNAHCVAAVQKVATFTVAGQQKQGGNVAAYFCTPDREVLHVVAGPVNEEVLLREARWVMDAWSLAQLDNLEGPAQLKAFFRQAHSDRLSREHQVRRSAKSVPMSLATLLDRHSELSTQGKVHLLLSNAPLAPIEMVYRPVFERILNERISTDPVNVVSR
jgi:hypothetical protein